ncbi:MAG: tRNA (uridine(34)/cytosine(34)/5-carboxymethylaminomethyluridine(34)-2'-O)-methyltransferase TrmL [Gammaproteobacteria bacterium]
MLNLVLFEPEIPPNTGNIIRLAANSGASLHLIRPLGFELDDKRLRRAGLDYHEFSRVRQHANWQSFLAFAAGGRIFGISTRGRLAYHQVNYQADDYLVFGPETRGLPAEIREQLGDQHILRIPMLPESRSLNLSNSAAVVIYEAWRQLGFEGGA